MGGCPNEAALLEDKSDGANVDLDDFGVPGSSDLEPTVLGDSDTHDGDSSPFDTGGGTSSGSNGDGTGTPNTQIELPDGRLLVVTPKGQSVAVLMNATPRSGPLTFEVIGAPVGGTFGPIVPVSPGSAKVLYTPNNDFVGREAFEYRASDGEVVSGARPVVIIVYPEVRFEVGPASGSRPLTVTARALATDPLPDLLYHWTFDDQGLNEFFSATPMQTFTFQSGGQHAVRLSLAIAGFATPIVCFAGTSGVEEAAYVTVDPVISGHVTDAEGRGLANVQLQASGTSLSATTDAAGAWSLQVAYGWTGSISASRTGYTFTPSVWAVNNLMRDQFGADFRGTANPPPNSGPTANAGAASIPEDIESTITLFGSDPDGDTLTYIIATLPPNGTLRDATDNHTITTNELPYTLRSNGPAVRYRAASNYNGSDQFQFRVRDAAQTSANASVQVTVQPVNDAPVALPQTVAVANAPQQITLTGMDVENTPLTFTIASSPAHGTLTGTPPNVTFTPTPGFSGADTFSFRAGDGQLTSAATTVTLSITQSTGGWAPPIGVPEPAFGVREEPPALPNPWNGTVTGFYYVDNTHGSSTDTSNTNGYPSRPRRTIPTNLPAGSMVEVRGGPYTNTTGGVIQLGGAGTVSQPIFIRGGGATKPRFTKPCEFRGSYVIVDGIDIDSWSTGNDSGISFGTGVHHCALRNSEVRNGPLATTSAVSVGGSSGSPSRYIVVYNTSIHDNGDWTATYDQDHHGVGVGEYSEHVWILDCQMYHNSGDGIQINAGSFGNMGTLHHVYVGGCHAWENKQTGMWSKFANDVVFSQNTVHDHRPSDSSGGAGMGWQYGPERVWILYNEIYNCEYGISCATISGPGGDGTGQNQYIIGNVIHDIRQTTSTTTGSWRSGAAITLRQEAGMVHVVNNTIYNCDSGVTNPRPNRCRIINNIFSNITLDHVWVENNNAANGSTLQYSLFDSPARLRWNGSTQRNLTQFRSTYPTQGTGCAEGNASFVNAAAGDFRLNAGSPAANTGTLDATYATFQSLYGVSIARAFDGAARPIGNWDMGAFER